MKRSRRSESSWLQEGDAEVDMVTMVTGHPSTPLHHTALVQQMQVRFKRSLRHVTAVERLTHERRRDD